MVVMLWADQFDARTKPPQQTPASSGRIDSAAVPDQVCIVGATGALGFGLALRWGGAGVPIVIGSRDAGRAQEAAERAKGLVPDGSFSGAQNVSVFVGSM